MNVEKNGNTPTLLLRPGALVPGHLICYNILSPFSDVGLLSPFSDVGLQARVAELADALASGASDSNVVQVQPLSRAPKLQNLENFHFITIAICKNDFRKTTSYVRLSSLMIKEIEKRFPEIKIEMDSNPTFYAELRKRIRERNLKRVKIRERNSRHSRLVQVANYVVNFSAKKAKNMPKSREWYNSIAKKVLAFMEIAD